MKAEKKKVLIFLAVIALLAIGIGLKERNRKMPSIPLLFYTTEGQYHVYDKKTGTWTIQEDEDWTEYVIEIKNQFYEIGEIIVELEQDQDQPVIFADQNFHPVKVGKAEPEVTVYPLNSRIMYATVPVRKKDEAELTLRGTLTRAGLKEKERMEASMATDAFAGKYMSVIGDSVSAYEHYIPRDYLTYYPSGDVLLQDMWWYQVAKDLGMYICRNNSCGASGVSEMEGDGLTPEMAADSGRGTRLHQAGRKPDVIFVWIGGNDVKGQVPQVTIDRSYRAMMRDITATYPRAEIYLCGYYPCYLDYLDPDQWLNQEIQEVAKDFGVKYLDLQECGITQENQPEYLYETDQVPQGIHPNQGGFRLIADCIVEQLADDTKH